MNYNKKKYVAVVILIAILVITGLLCFKHNKPISDIKDKNNFKIVTTFYPIYIHLMIKKYTQKV